MSTKIKWYRRSGERIAEERVARAKQRRIDDEEAGIDTLGRRRTPRPELAQRFREMSLIEFANYTGCWTYRIKKESAS